VRYAVANRPYWTDTTKMMQKKIVGWVVRVSVAKQWNETQHLWYRWVVLRLNQPTANALF
jgi:hypothetical protein